MKCLHENKRALFMSVPSGWKKTDYLMCDKCYSLFKKYPSLPISSNIIKEVKEVTK